MALWRVLSVNISASLDSYLFFVVLAGRGELKYKGQTYELSTGDGVFLNCADGYSQQSLDHKDEAGNFDELWSLSWVHFNGASMSPIYTKYKECGGKSVFHCEQSQRYVDLAHSIFTIASSDSYVRDMQLAGKLTDLLTYLMEDAWCGDACAEDGRDAHTAPKRQLVRKVNDYIDEHYTASLSLQSLASQFYINKEYLAKLFKETYVYTVNGYISIVRVTHAKEMLRFTDMSVGEIGYAVGIEDENYFSRVFKRVEGISPSKGNVDGFAELLTQHWKESQRIDSGSTNTCIDMIFESIDDLVLGKMICGAGGGGFLQVVLKKDVTKEELRERLNEVFQDSGVDVWDCEFV